MNSRIVLLFIFLLTVNSMVYSQGLIKPDNLLKRSYSGFDEWCIQAYEYPDGGSYLFPVIHFQPSSGHSNAYSTLVKSDGNGNIVASFSTPYDSAYYSYNAQSIAILDNEVVLIVGFDAIQTEVENIGVIYYVLDSATLSYKYSDTLFNPFPGASTLGGAYTLKQPRQGINYGVQLVSSPTHFTYASYSYKLYKDGQGKVKCEYVSHDSLFINNKLQYEDFATFDIQLNATNDSLFIYKLITVYGSSPISGALKSIITLDTGFKNVSVYITPQDTIQMPNGMILAPPFNSGHDILHVNNDEFIQGPFCSDLNSTWSYPVNALLKFSKSEIRYTKALILPDTTNSSHSKLPSWFNSLDTISGAIYSVSFERIQGQVNDIIGDTSNYIYVGKTDTSLNAWHWYRYIRSPHVYLFPQYVLATADGGCMITAGAYDYVNNPNRAHEFIVIKLNEQGTVTSISNPKGAPQHSYISIYPVPAQQELFIDYNGTASFNLYIVDISGKVIKRYESLDRTTRSVSVQDLPVGSYLCRFVLKNGEQQVLKLIKE